MEWLKEEGDKKTVRFKTYYKGQEFPDFEAFLTWEGFLELTLNYKGGSEEMRICDLTNFIEMLKDLEEKAISHFEENPLV
jgi:hypothetical protein